MLNNKKGQSTVEYIVLVTAVVFVIISFMITGGEKSVFREKLNGTLDKVAGGMSALSEGQLATSHTGATGNEKQSDNAKAQSGVSTPVLVNKPPDQPDK